MKQKTFQNPLKSGFYPDPSICRVGDDYYMVTSSFVYFPGLPIFHSKDLVHWEQIGHGIHSPEQLDYKNCETSLGLWAPSIRYHDGTFYIINTFISEGREARRDNYIITAKDPAGPWSKACFVEGADGIDSSLFFDDDGRMYYAGNYIVSDPVYEGHHGIYLCELDPETFQFKGERTVIWNGLKSRSKWIEAPHIYKHDGWYYLIVAEGGTFTNHSVMMARCRTIDGDYEICPRNPIVSHRHMSLMSEISVVGHADIVETQRGEWWMVLLGVRPYDGFGEPHFNLGRETFMVPVVWESDGWLRVFLKEEVLHEICTPAFIGRRQQHKNFRMQFAMDFQPTNPCEEAGAALVQDDRYHYTFTVGLKNGSRVLTLTEVKNHVRTVLAETPLEKNGRIYLTVAATPEGYHFYYGYSDQEFQLLCKNVDPTLLSSLVNEGFTGAYIGMYATSNHSPVKNHADFDWVLYEAE